MFDTHCHINLEPLVGNLLSVITTGRKSGVSHFLIPGVNLKTSHIAVRIANDYENTYCAVGIHPSEYRENMDLGISIKAVSDLALESDKVVAIGEIGLDYYQFTTPPRIQKLLLVEQLKLATMLDKTIIIHSRLASEDMLHELTDFGLNNLKNKLVFHCCESNPEILKFAEKNELYIGVDGDVTYDLVKQNFIRKVPLELLILETDSPFLMPEPMRSMRPRPKYNEPKNLKYIVYEVAKIKGISVEKIVQQTTTNTVNLFGI